MKKFIITMFITTLLAMSASAGGLWSMVKNTNSEGTIETKQYTIEVSGTDIRAYVFNVPAMKSICISAWGSTGASHQLQCKTYKEIGGTK